MQVEAINRHPNADRLDVLTLTGGIRVVTGPHYEVGQLGVYFAPGAVLPGYLAADLWLKGRGAADCWVEVGTKNMRGVESPGVFAGCRWQNDRTSPYRDWPYWLTRWSIGNDVSAYLGVR